MFNTAAAKYIRTFEFLDKSARIDLIQAWQTGRWSGLLNGVPADVERDGWADTSLRFAVNLLGTPPLAGTEFAEYRARTKIETIVGVGLDVQFPTGEYFEDKLINLNPTMTSICKRSACLAALTLAAAPAHAGDTTQPVSVTPVPIRETLTDDWFGRGSTLREHGVNLTGSFAHGLKDGLRLVGLPARDECGLEVFYNMALTPWLRVTANTQVIRPPVDDRDTAILAGLRAVISF